MRKSIRELFRWHGSASPNIGQILAVIIGMTVPIALGECMGHPQSGIFASFGGLALSSATDTGEFTADLKNLVYALLAGGLAFLMGSYISHSNAATLFLLPVIIFAVSLVGGISRLMARSTTIFLLFLIIAASFGSIEATVVTRTALFLMGAVWALVLFIVFRPIGMMQAGTVNGNTQQKYTIHQLLGHWRRGLRRFSGWQYSLRITLCAIVAVSIMYLFPMRHALWILLTIVIVVQRNSDHLTKRMLQRGIGTFIGVMILGLLTSYHLPSWLTIAVIAALAGVRVYLREGNYLFYAIVMTALVVILLDFGKELSYQAMLDRLIATTIGCIVSFVFGYLVWLRLIRSQR
ncbi:MAG TPA: FUSC family protein [Syntrophales bacterium]|nr:FUSC family protein [Syntrophales bacterium]HPQ43984.1 FUSC family protein [Syntrophales bacterium]